MKSNGTVENEALKICKTNFLTHFIFRESHIIYCKKFISKQVLFANKSERTKIEEA